MTDFPVSTPDATASTTTPPSATTDGTRATPLTTAEVAQRRIVSTGIEPVETRTVLRRDGDASQSSAALWLDVSLNPLLTLQLNAQHCCARFSRPLDALSSAVLNGGKTRASAWLNLHVMANAPADACFPTPQATLSGYGDAIDLPVSTVGMMTAASMKSCRIRYFKRDQVFVCSVATVGIANARRAGDPADDDRWQACQRNVGTINIAVFTNANLSDTAKVEALQLIAEAKTAACHDSDLASPVSGLIATGTGTDASAIFCDPEGLPIDYCGKHVIMGEAIGSLVYDVVKEGIAACRLIPK